MKDKYHIITIFENGHEIKDSYDCDYQANESFASSVQCTLGCGLYIRVLKLVNDSVVQIFEMNMEEKNESNKRY